MTNFGVQTSEIYKKICDIVENESSKFFEISHWFDEAKQKWFLIDKFNMNIDSFKNLKEYENDMKV